MQANLGHEKYVSTNEMKTEVEKKADKKASRLSGKQIIEKLFVFLACWLFFFGMWAVFLKYRHVSSPRTLSCCCSQLIEESVGKANLKKKKNYF